MIAENRFITTELIMDKVIGNKGLKKASNGYTCSISLYKCNLEEDFVHDLFNFEIDTSFSMLSPDIYINIPSGTCKDVYEHGTRYSNAAQSFLLNLIPKSIREAVGVELAFVTFSVLHEIGHWEHFCRLKCTPIEYCEHDSMERTEFLCLYGDKLESQEALKKYRDISSEKAAD